MRVASSLVAFVFLGVVAAGVVPDIAGRNNAVTSGNGGHIASMSGVRSHPSGSPTGTAVDSFPSSAHSHSPAPRRAANPTFVHSVHPSGRAEPTGGHSHSPAASHTASRSGASANHATRSGQPARSGFPSGASAHPSDHAHKSGSPSDASVLPQPTATSPA